MTAPFAPPLNRLQVIVTLGLITFAAVMPFVRRDDWVGWTAFLMTAALTAGLWGLLLWSMVRAILHWWHGEHDSP